MSFSFFTAQKMNFSLRISSVNMTNMIRRIADLVTLTEEMLDGKLDFLCSVRYLI